VTFPGWVAGQRQVHALSPLATLNDHHGWLTAVPILKVASRGGHRASPKVANRHPHARYWTRRADTLSDLVASNDIDVILGGRGVLPGV